MHSIKCFSAATALVFCCDAKHYVFFGSSVISFVTCCYWNSCFQWTKIQFNCPVRAKNTNDVGLKSAVGRAFEKLEINGSRSKHELDVNMKWM